ncbi:NAD-binding protein [Candidatus Woesearchaeota archaeon]|nr:NAD-binding protein [Candidatus Woesearchaeota archaeon]
MPDETITIIGLGEIGTAIYDDISCKGKKVFGVDVNEERVKELREKGYNAGKEIPESDVYIIAVYMTEQVIEVLNKISTTNALISIESTINPAKINEIKKICSQKGDIVIFPHRFNPNDAKHRVFNLNRVLGADDERAKERALKFYTQFMPMELITTTTLQIAALSKLLENTHRFAEIAIAQNYKESCDRLGIDFEHLRKTANTKWNIDIKEARDGIKGKCLPKDTEILANFFGNEILKMLIEHNKEYIVQQR